MFQRFSPPRVETKGRAEGMREKALEAAQKFLEAGVPAETVASCTGLNVDEIREMERK